MEKIHAANKPQSTMIIVGLGNPGMKYKKTRHNAGFMVIDALHKRYEGEDFVYNKKLKACIAKVMIGSQNVILAKPDTFMNDSGSAVQALVHYYKLDPSNHITVIHDDLDLPFGKWKESVGRGAAGQNGVKDIIEKISTKDFARIRVGIDNRTSDMRANGSGSNYVLGMFTNQEQEELHDVYAEIISQLHKKIT